MGKNILVKRILLAILFVAAIGLGWWWQDNARRGKYADLLSAFYIMGEIHNNYYQPVDFGKLMNAYWQKGNIAGMLKILDDPYTRFLSKNQYAELRKDTTGSFGGIGIYLLFKEGELIISKVVKDSPGDRGGLKMGDRIVAINNTPVKGLSSEVAVAKIRGAVGTKVLLKIARGNNSQQKLLNLTIIRANISVPTVELTTKNDPMIGKYAIIKIHQFAETTGNDVKKNLVEIDKAGDYKGLILDLRENPGGALNAAVSIVSEFVPQGTPILYVYRRGNLIETIKAEYNVHKQLPMVILVDGWSASASEIVTGALKDLRRAKVVGTATFGKDLIQQVKTLPGDEAVTITIANYLTPGKVSIHKKGVQPDIMVGQKEILDRVLKTGDLKPFYKMQEEQNAAALRILRNQIQVYPKAS